MSRILPSLINQSDEICLRFADHRDLIAVGITFTRDEPHLLILSHDKKSSLDLLQQDFPQWAHEEIEVRESTGFRKERHQGSEESLLDLVLDVARLTLGASEALNSSPRHPAGTLGCLLRDSGGGLYGLTAGHVFPVPGAPVYVGMTQVGMVLSVSESGNDWSLFKIVPEIMTTLEILGNSPRTLTGPMDAGDLESLTSMARIGLTGMGQAPSVGGFVGLMCVRYETRDAAGQPISSIFRKQIVVQDLGSQSPFGIPGDSGAVGYLVAPFRASRDYSPGAAVGLYWGRSQTYHALTPLQAVLSDVAAKTGLSLDLLR